MKLGSVTKLNKRKKQRQKFNDAVMTENFDVIVIFTI